MRYPLDQIVREFLIEKFGAEQVDNRYPRLLQIAISGLRDMNIRGNIVSSKIIKLAVNDNDTVDLPNDYVDYIRVSICYNNQMLALGLNKNMCPNDYDDCGDIKASTLNSLGCGNGIYSLNETGDYVGKNFGGGTNGNSIGYYKFYDGYIALQGMSSLYNEIILEYISDPAMVDGTHLIHDFDVETLKAYMWWKYIEANRTYNMGEKDLARKLYGKLKKESRIMKGAFTISEFLSAVNSGYRPTI